MISTQISVTLSVTGIRLIVIPFSIGVAFGSTILNKVLCDLVLNIFMISNKYEERAQQAIVSFDKNYREGLQDNFSDERRIWLFFVKLLQKV